VLLLDREIGQVDRVLGRAADRQLVAANSRSRTISRPMAVRSTVRMR
jgi:hypothetical protein